MKRWRRMLALFLTVVLLGGTLPLEVLAEEPERGFIEVNGQVMVYSDGETLDGPLPNGVSYTSTGSNSGTLTLNNAQLTSISAWGLDSLVIQLVGTNTISLPDSSASEMDTALRFGQCSAATIQGDGTLTVNSPQHAVWFESTDAEIPDTLTITGGATVTAESSSGYWADEAAGQYGYCAFSGRMNLVVEKNATLNAVSSWMGILIEGNATIGTGGTVNVNRIHMHGDNHRNEEAAGDEITATTIKVTNGGTLNVTPRENEAQDSFFALINNATLSVEGGKVCFDAQNRGEEYSELLSINPGCEVRVTGGELVFQNIYNAKAIFVQQRTTFTQTGGTVRISRAADAPDKGDRYGAVGLEVMAGGQANIIGGTFETNGLDCAINLRGEMTVSGENTSLNLKKGYNAAISLMPLGSLSVLGGTINAVTSGTYGREAIYGEGGLVRFLGGTTTLTAPQFAVMDRTGNTNVVTLGAGMHAVGGNRQETALDVSDFGSEYNFAYYPEETVTISSTPGASPYAALMEVVNGGQVTAGTVFTVRTALAMTGSGTISFTLPEGIVLQDGSVTVNGQAVPEGQQGLSSLSVKNSDIVRFSAVASKADDYTITAAVNDGGQNHPESMKLSVSALTLSLPTQVNRTSIPVSGHTVPGSTVNLYEGQTDIGMATADSLGSWSTTIQIEDRTGSHSIHAVVTQGSQTVTTSDPFTLDYAPDNAEVETLTMTNWIHGKTSADPNVQETFVINYQNGTRNKNFYTYWPDLPTFTFAVAFVGDSGTPDKVEDVTVVTTDWTGEETEVPLAYDASTGTWMGQHDYDGVNVPNPERFRVEWMPAGTVLPEEPEETPIDVPEREEVEENDSDGAFLSEDTDFTFEISDGAVLTLTDSAGKAVNYSTDTSGTIVSAEYASGELYVAHLESGTFPDYPGYDTLYIQISGEKIGVSTCEYISVDVVHDDVDPATLTFSGNTFTSTDNSYKVNDVLILNDGGTAIVITDKAENTYTYEEAGLGDIYTTLDVNKVASLNPDDLILEGLDEAAIVRSFMETETYGAFRSAVATYADENGYEDVEELPVSFDLEMGLEGTLTHPVLILKPVITVESSMTTKLPFDQETETAVKGVFSYELRQGFDFGITLENRELQSLYLTRDQTETVEIDISVTIGEAPDEGAEAKIEEYFGQTAVEQFLEDLEGGDDESEPGIPLGEFRIPTNVPGLFIYASLELETDVSFFGELVLHSQLTQGQVDGLLYTQNGGFQKFCQPKEETVTANMELHLRASASAALTASAGVELWAVIDAGLYVTAGPTITFGGHGTASYSNAPGSNSLEAELLVTCTLDVDAGVTASIKLARALPALEWSQSLYEASFPIFQLGANVMPTRFKTVEEDMYVQSNSDLTQLLDLTLLFQSFTAEVGGKTIHNGEKIFEPEDYTFELVDHPQGVSLDSKGKLSITANEERKFQVKVTYTGSTEDYQIWKIVTLKYTPASFVIQKAIQDGASKVAGYSVVDLYDGSTRSFTTSPAGFVVVPAVAGHSYQVVETWCAQGYYPVEAVKQVTVPESGANTTVTFQNVRKKKQRTQDIDGPGLGDPSGYVYEGIESNRLSGVTVSLYQASTADGTDADLWNAGDYAQTSVLTTDALGQYLWMVPNGSWWQVVATAGGYETACSAWLPVPPVQTGVNLGMVSKQPADMTVSAYSGQNVVFLRFTRPVLLSSLTDLTVTVNGRQVEGNLVPVDADWSVTQDPEDSQPCATTFCVYLEQPLSAGAAIAAQAAGVTTYAEIQADVQDTGVVEDSGEPGPGPEPEPEPEPDVPSGGSSSSSASYQVTVDKAEGGKITVSPARAEKGDTVTITVKPDEGYELEELTVTDKDGGKVTITQKDDNKYTFKMPAGKVTVTATFTEIVVEPEQPELPFADVAEQDWFYDAVVYVYENGLMNGTAAAAFSPTVITSRAMMLTMLARYDGVDTSTGSTWYEAGAAWAVAEGISDGTNLEADLTREQLVTMLWRYAGSPMVEKDLPDYPDRDKVSDWAVRAMVWAVDEGIITGNGAGELNPQGSASRAEVATILMRFVESLI